MNYIIARSLLQHKNSYEIEYEGIVIGNTPGVTYHALNNIKT